MEGSFRLRLQIYGLCCFYPKGNGMYVLLPGTGPGAAGTYGSKADQHLAHIGYDLKYDGTGAKGQRHVPLVGDLILKNSTTFGFNPDLDSSVLAIPTVIRGATFNETALDDAPPQNLLMARFKLIGGSMGQPCLGYRWDVGPNVSNKQLSWCTEWIIDNYPGTQLDFSIVPFFSNLPYYQGTLYPSGGNEIVLRIMHILADEDEDKPTTIHHDSSLQKHFLAYYDLFTLPMNAAVYYPMCHIPGTCEYRDRHRLVQPFGYHPWAGSASTCALSGGH